jgi:hypothetical protein
MVSMLPALEVWLVTVVAHTAVGGSLPSVPWLVSGAGLVALTTGWMVGGASLRVAVPVLTAAQVALHVALTSMPAPDHAHAHAAHAAHTTSVASPGVAVSFDLSWRMVIAHLLSAALTAMIWRLRRRAVEVLLGLPGVPAALSWRTSRSVTRVGGRGFRSLPWLLGDPGRAPPRMLATA